MSPFEFDEDSKHWVLRADLLWGVDLLLRQQHATVRGKTTANHCGQSIARVTAKGYGFKCRGLTAQNLTHSINRREKSIHQSLFSSEA